MAVTSRGLDALANRLTRGPWQWPLARSESGRRHLAAAGADSVVIEIIGPAGAGKSTLVARLEHLLRRQGTEVVAHRAIGFVDPDGRPESKVRRRANQALSLLSNPRLVLWCWRYGRSTLDSKTLVAMCVRARFAKRLRRRPGIHLLDEGPLRIAPVLFAHAQGRGPELLAFLPLPQLVVALTVDPDVPVERVQARPVGTISSAAALERLRSANRLHTSALETIQQTVPAIQLDTTRGEDHTAAARDWILSQLRRRPDADSGAGR